MTDLETAWTNGYDLDGGGYAFEEPEAESFWTGKPVLLWGDPDLDYILGGDIMRGVDDTADLLVVAPNSGHFAAYEFPESYQDEDGDTWKRISQGHLNPTDHECNCHGKFVEWTGGAGEPQNPEDPDKVLTWLQAAGDELGSWIEDDLRSYVLLDMDGEAKALLVPVNWKFTGNSSDKAHPGCTRCDGDGYLDSPGGEWAIYTRVWEN